MDFPQRAVFFLEEDSSLPAHSKPLMLEAVLFCPILKWMSDKLLADGVQRFFAVSSPRFAQEVRACFPEDADVTISEQHSELLDFLNTPDPVAVFVRAALPMEEAGPGFVYGAAGYELQAVWQEKMTNAVSAAELIPGWVPVFSLETVAELEPLLRERIVRRHIRAGVRVLDPNAVYIDPRVTIGRGTMLLPGTILRGETAVGCGCTIGPNAVVRDCVIGDETEINASQVNESTIGSRTYVGPFAYVRPGCAIGDDSKVGDFIQTWLMGSWDCGVFTHREIAQRLMDTFTGLKIKELAWFENPREKTLKNGKPRARRAKWLPDREVDLVYLYSDRYLDARNPSPAETDFFTVTRMDAWGMSTWFMCTPEAAGKLIAMDYDNLAVQETTIVG